MDEQTAEKLGRHARAAALPAGTVFSPQMCEALDGKPVGDRGARRLMEAYSRGWNRENQRLAEQELRDAGFNE